MADRYCLWCGERLTKRRRKYCSDEHGLLYWARYVAPQELQWSVASHQALKRDWYVCQDCGRPEGLQPWTGLEVHHIVPLDPSEERWNSPKNYQENLVTLCRPCHELRHHPPKPAPEPPQPPPIPLFDWAHLQV